MFTKKLETFGKYVWTQHSLEKLQYYGLSQSRIIRIIRFPTRYEEGVAPNTVAVMQPAGSKQYQEIWAMYKIEKEKKKESGPEEMDASDGKEKFKKFTWNTGKKIKIITAWRYPGKSPERDPVPQEIILEVQRML
jgi:hypothetical protein